MLEHGADPNRKDSEWRTGLHYAAQFDDEAVIKSLLEHHADPNLQDIMGMTPLMYACMHSKATLIRLLISGRAKVSMKDYQDCTALDYTEGSKDKSLHPLVKEALQKEQAEQHTATEVTK